MVVSKIVVSLHRKLKTKTAGNGIQTATKKMTNEIKLFKISAFAGAAAMIAGFITCHPIILAVGIACGTFAVTVILSMDK